MALALLTLVWGLNWAAMKAALMHAHPLVFNVHRTWLAAAVLFGVLIALARALAGMLLVVEPWAWEGDLTPKLCSSWASYRRPAGF